MKKYRLLIIGILLCLLSGCKSNENIDGSVITAEERDLTAKEFVISYETKVYTPNVLVNQAGYQATDKKNVYFLGDNLSEIFQVLEYDTDLVVFEGSIEKTIKDGYAIGDFTELKKPGKYYIKTKKIGESYPFSIAGMETKEKIFHQLLENQIAKDPSEYVEKDTLTDLIPLLLAHEMYQTSFLDGDVYTIPNQIPDILDYLDAVAISLVEEEEETESNVNHVFLEAAFFAKLSYNFNEYDAKKTKEYQAIAINQYSKAILLLTEDESITEYESYAYFAATELYRSTGKYMYRKDAEKYGERISSLQEKNVCTFYADVTHMSTRRTVTVDFCNERMDTIRLDVIGWTENAGKYPFFYELKSVDSLLIYGMKILWINEINYSEEYDELEKEIEAYLTGLNTEGLSYISEMGYTYAEEIFEKRLDLNNKFLVLISGYMQQESIE